MVEKFVTFVSGIVFGKQYFDGYIREPENKPHYNLVELFPNEIAKERAIRVLEK